MMGSDARDLMGLPSAGPSKPAAAPKASKPKVRGPSGMAREVLDLNYEGAPPISIVAPKFKDKPKLPFKPRRWEQTPFANSARADGLVLYHWKRAGESLAPNGAHMPVTPADSNAASEMETEEKVPAGIEDSRAAQWNVRISRPEYTDAEYDEKLTSEDWSREETDYLVDLATDLDLRWVLIGDRYDYKPSQPAQFEEQPDADSMAVDQQSPIETRSRTTEDMKVRYYAVAAHAMAMKTPLASMSSAEFETHEKMARFDAIRETRRKRYAERLLHRTQEEAHEEELLLRELSRIVTNQEKFYQERKALYDRLEAPRPLNLQAAHAASTIYSTSQGLQQLMQSMIASQRLKESERKDKRRSLEAAADSATPQGGNHAGGDNTKGSSHKPGGGGAGGTSAQEKRQAQSNAQIRQLSQIDRAKFGLTWPQERLVAGVQFRHERVVKASQAKSTIQTTRMNDALSELGIPPRLFMPTAKVVAEYDHLVDGVKRLIEVRKVREKVDGEIRVLEAQKKLAGGGSDGATDDATNKDTKTEFAAAGASQPAADGQNKPASDAAEKAGAAEGGESSAVKSEPSNNAEGADQDPSGTDPATSGEAKKEQGEGTVDQTADAAAASAAGVKEADAAEKSKDAAENDADEAETAPADGDAADSVPKPGENDENVEAKDAADGGKDEAENDAEEGDGESGPGTNSASTPSAGPVTRPRPGTRKRSASILSDAVSNTAKAGGNKRQRK